MKTVVALTVLLTGIVATYAADETVTGNLTVTGVVDIQGSSLSVGDDGGSPSNPLLEIQPLLQSGVLSINQVALPQNEILWRWATISGGNPLPLLELQRNSVTPSHQLVIYASDGATAGITLLPEGQSVFAASLKSLGTDNELPNQVLANADRILTRGLADGRYLRADQSVLVFGSGSSADGSSSIALGAGSSADGSPTVGSLALGSAASAGEGASAIGVGASAAALNSLALGTAASAGDEADIAVGHASVAGGGSAVAIGEGAKVLKLGQVALGRFNAFDAAGTADPLDVLFAVGNGTSDTLRSNAFVVKRNGDTVVTGGLETAGETSFAGEVTVSDSLKISSGAKLLVAPQGDVDMGDFTNGEKPPGVP